MKQTYKKATIAFVIFAMVIAIYGVVPNPRIANAADSMIDAKDTISDSDFSVAAQHTISFTTTHAVPNGHIINFIFPVSGAGDGFAALALGNVSCGTGSWVPSIQTTNVANDTLRCTSNGANAAGAFSMLATTTNPSSSYPGSRLVQINHYDSVGGTLLETVQVVVAIVDDVTMTAKVNASLTFTISGVNAGDYVNGVRCTATTTATTTNFGTLTSAASTTVCQTLSVKTNADDGFVVTVKQDQELTSDGGATINSFVNSQDGTGSSTAVAAWSAPTALLDVYNTYGHMGLTSDDADLSAHGYLNFYNGGAARYAGLNGVNSMPIMDHTGPTLGTTASTGLSHVAYTAQISDLQEAGEYQSSLTYIATPTF